MKKIDSRRYVIIHGNVFTKSDWERFGCDYFERSGYEVLALECINVFYPVSRNQIETEYFYVSKKSVSLENKEDLYKIIIKLKQDDIVLMLWPLCKDTAWVYKMFSKLGLRYSVINGGAIPDSYIKDFRTARTFSDAIRFLINNFRGFIYEIRQFMALRCDPALGYSRLSAPSFWLKSGKYRERRFNPYPKLHRARIIRMQSYDVIRAKRAASEQPLRISQPPYSVFMAVPFIEGPDKILVPGTETVASPERHFSALNRLFGKIEKDLRLKVIISAHPKIDLRVESSFYDGRQIHIGESAALTRDASLVLCPSTTAVSYAVYFRKPIIFVTTKELDAINQWWREIRTFASWFSCPPVVADDVDESTALIIPDVNEDKYRRYQYEFLEEPDAEINPWKELHRLSEQASLAGTRV